jgi:hypothetical protein
MIMRVDVSVVVSFKNRPAVLIIKRWIVFYLLKVSFIKSLLLKVNFIMMIRVDVSIDVSF